MIRAIDALDNDILVGCANGSIYQSEQATEIMCSHNDGEVWGLDTNGSIVATSGDDNQVILWDTEKRKKLSSVIVSNDRKSSRKGRASSLGSGAASQMSRSIIFCQNGGLIVAANDGRVHVWKNPSDPKACSVLDDSEEWIQSMSLSPDGSRLAVGSHDNRIYIYSTADYSL